MLPSKKPNYAAVLDRLRGDHSELDFRLTFLAESVLTRTRPARARLFCVTLRDGSPLNAELIGFLVDRMVSYCLPRRERQHAIEELAGLTDEGRQALFSAHDRKARKLFKASRAETNTSGEWAELLLYALLEHVHKAPQIVSKMYLKTSRQMHVHGRDGIHLRWNSDDNTAELIWGESKGYASYGAALSAALASICDFVTDPDKYRRDIDIAQDHIDLGDADEATVAAVEAYINPYTRTSLKRREVYACLLAYDDTAYEKLANYSVTERDDALHNLLKQAIGEKIVSLQSECGEPPHDELNFEFFLVPVSSVQALRDAFDERADL